MQCCMQLSEKNIALLIDESEGGDSSPSVNIYA